MFKLPHCSMFLCLEWIFFIWEFSKLLWYELIKDVHSIKIKFELGRQPQLINMDHNNSHGFFLLIQWSSRKTTSITNSTLGRTTAIFEVMKRLGIPHHDCFSNYFLNEIWGRKCGNFHKLKGFTIIWNGVPRALLINLI